VTKFSIATFCCLAVTASTTYGAQAKPKITPDMLQTYRTMIEMNIEADNTLFGYMESINKLLLEFTARTGRFPDGREAQLVESQLSERLVTNPYKANPPKVKLVLDHSLMKEHLEQLIASSICAAMEEPGTITAISNGDNVLVIWGAGSDRKVIRDRSAKPRIIVSALQR
jgi:hypothetical protein